MLAAHLDVYVCMCQVSSGSTRVQIKCEMPSNATWRRSKGGGGRPHEEPIPATYTIFP